MTANTSSHRPGLSLIGWTTWAAFVWLFHGLAHAAGDEETRTPVGVPEEVLVLGEQPGPGLWKVSKGAHTLWLLGTYVPTPKDMVWRSKQVEQVIAASNEVLGPYSASLRVKQERSRPPSCSGSRRTSC